MSIAKFYCGCAREIITPPIGTLLYGYRPDVDSREVHDDLTASVVAFSSDKNDTSLMFSITLGDLQTELSDELRALVGAKTNLPPENIIIAATHTHCGPNTSGVEGWGDIDRSFVDNILIPAMLKSAVDAIDNMVSAEVGIAVGQSLVGINRRQQMPDGNISLGQNPWGCFDPNMTVIVIRDSQTHKGIVNLVHYGCHGTACGCAHEITRDWSGMMIDRLEKQTDTLTVFLNGAIGDVGPRLTNGQTVGDITHVEELGSLAAIDAMGIYGQVGSFNVPDYILHKGTVGLPRQSYPSLEHIEKELAKINDPESLINSQRLQYAHLRDLKALLSNGEPKTPKPLELQQTIIQVGDIAFIPFPFEPFSEISMRLRAYSHLPYTLMLSCCNGYFGYLPSQDQLCRGGYEVDVFRYANTDALSDNTDQHIIDENLRILRG